MLHEACAGAVGSVVEIGEFVSYLHYHNRTRRSLLIRGVMKRWRENEGFVSFIECCVGQEFANLALGDTDTTTQVRCTNEVVLDYLSFFGSYHVVEWVRQSSMSDDLSSISCPMKHRHTCLYHVAGVSEPRSAHHTFHSSYA